jgi:peptidoglycan/xylan/chitin deacetylase (PgdA/CDA1 family)
MKGLRPTLTFGLPALAAVVISAAFTARRATRADAKPPEHFSGSRVVLKMPSLLASPKLPSRVRVDVVRDDAAAEFYDSPSVLDAIVRRWRDNLAATGADVRIVSPAALRGSNARVIVVPSSPCLTVATREAIEAAGARGHGLIVTGRAGTHDAGCRQLGFGTLIALTGASRAEELRERPMVYVTIPSDGPLSAGIPPGARLDIAPASQIALRSATRDAFYSEYTLGSAPARGEAYFDAAMARSTYRGARVVYFGFELRDVVRSLWDDELLRLLVRNAVAWAGGIPMATTASWPAGYTSAAVLAQDVENKFDEAAFAVDSLRAIGVRSSFFVMSDLASRNKRLTRKMLEIGEVGTHTENHQLLGGQPLATQIERLHVTRSDLGKLTRIDVAGLRPPEEQFDMTTMRAWLASGGTYLLGANDSRCAAPELLPVGRDTLLLVPRVFDDDFTVMTPHDWRRPSVVRSLFAADIEKARAVGGLYLLSYHSQLLSRPEYVPVLARIARDLKADSSVWIATAGDVATWWMDRARLDILVAPTTNALDVTVRNRGDRTVSNAVVLVTLPKGKVLRGASAPAVMRADGTVGITLPPLAARSTRVVRVILAPR